MTVRAIALRGQFGLTPKESAVAAALAEGKPIDAIATEFGVIPIAARTHLKSLLAKTWAGLQAQLVTLLVRSVAARGDG